MSKATILVADDDKDFRLGVVRRLEHAGYRVIEAGDGAGAIRAAKKEAPDLLILDVHMPSVDGFVSVEKMDNDQNLSRLPVIYVTGDGAESTRMNAALHGAIAVLHKPLNMAELLEAVNVLIGPGDTRNVA